MKRNNDNALTAPLLAMMVVLAAATALVWLVQQADGGGWQKVAEFGKLFAKSEAEPPPADLVRRAEAGEGDVIRIKDLIIDVPGHRVLREGVELGISGKEYDLLVFLVRNAGQAVSRTEISRHVWGVTGDDASKKLDMHVSWLRRKLGDAVAEPRYISTIRGLGFRFEKE